jgi:hypothetical protein
LLKSVIPASRPHPIHPEVGISVIHSDCRLVTRADIEVPDFTQRLASTASGRVASSMAGSPLILSVRETWLSEIIVVEAQAVRSGIEDAAKNDPQEPSADNMAFAIHLQTKPLRLLPFVQRENISERPNVPGRPSHTR